MSLQDDRVAFTRLVARLLVWMETAPWGEWCAFERIEFAVDEWTIASPRKLRKTLYGETFIGYDAVHAANSKHHSGLALDLLIWIDDVYLKDGDHPIWKEIDLHCREMRPDFGLGLRFTKKDSNHLSLGEGF